MEIETTFLYKTLVQLLEEGVLRKHFSVLVVFGGEFDRIVLDTIGFTNVVYSNIDSGQLGSKNSIIQDARSLYYEDRSFDLVVAHAGIHHADRPHQAVCEMYRVAKKVVFFVESQDSMFMRLAVRLGLVPDYETNAIRDHDYRRGGVNDTPIPNFVYRWTTREVEKMIRTLDPVHEPCIKYYSEWDLSWTRLQRRVLSSPAKVIPVRLLSLAIDTSSKFVNWVAGSQGNLFAVCIRKDAAQLQPWIEIHDDNFSFRDSVKEPNTDITTLE